MRGPPRPRLPQRRHRQLRAHEAVTAAFWDQTFDINLKGAFFAAQRFARLVKKGGSIVLNTSVVDVKGFPASTVYAASKAALRSLARTLSADLLGLGIRVHAVSPGPINTPIYGKLGFPAEVAEGSPRDHRRVLAPAVTPRAR